MSLAVLLNSLEEDKVVKEIPVIQDFLQIFSNDILGLPLDQETEFTINLEPSAIPVYKIPYRMALVELKELKVQIEKLLKKGFIRLSTFPWGASVLYVKKKRWNNAYVHRLSGFE